jgi:glycosyltransferase 2 family protein
MASDTRNRTGFVVTGLFLALFIGSVVAALAATGWEETLAALSRLGPVEIGILLVLSLGNYVSRALRWHLLTRMIHLPTGLGQDFRHYFGGFALTATPGRLGEFVRLRWMSRETGWPIDRAAPVALADRASELAAVALLLAVAVGLSTLGLATIAPLILISLGLAWIASSPRLLHRGVTLAWRAIGRWPRLFGRLRRMVAGLAPFVRPGVALPALALGGIGWFLEGLAFALLLDWLGAPVPLWTAVAIFLAAMISGALAGLPGGLGGAEAAMIGLLLFVGVPLEVALPATAIIRVTTLWFAILIGIGVFPLAEAQSRAGLRPA